MLEIFSFKQTFFSRYTVTKVYVDGVAASSFSYEAVRSLILLLHGRLWLRLTFLVIRLCHFLVIIFRLAKTSTFLDFSLYIAFHP